MFAYYKLKLHTYSKVNMANFNYTNLKLSLNKVNFKSFKISSLSIFN